LIAKLNRHDPLAYIVSSNVERRSLGTAIKRIFCPFDFRSPPLA
jgi:hypothetical protein